MEDLVGGVGSRRWKQEMEDLVGGVGSRRWREEDCRRMDVWIMRV
jgi:hypothetical protein